MSVLLQVSDTHFGTERAPVVAALVALAAQQQPDLLVLSGDITQRARAAQFHAARELVQRLGLPLLAIPGNHDIPLFDLWTRATRPYTRYAAAFGDALAPVHATDELLVLGVNTTRAWRHKHGQVSAAQIQQVAERLAAAGPRQLRVVVVHQPVAVPCDDERVNLLRGHAAALAPWAATGADLVMGGHIHLPYVQPLPGLARPMWAVQAGTAVSSRVRAGVPNSVNLLRWHADTCRCAVERWDFADDAQAFVRLGVTELRPRRP